MRGGLSGFLSGAAAALRARGSPGAAGGGIAFAKGARGGRHRLGPFTVVLGREAWSGHFVEVRHASSPGRALWRSLPGRGFLAAGRGRALFRDRRSHYAVRDRLEEAYPEQTVEGVERRGEALLELWGRLRGPSGQVGYRLSLSPASQNRLRFEAEAEGGANRLYLTYASEPGERFFGFGEQFTHLDMKGRRVPILIGEQGVGRGAQPVTLLMNLRYGSGGSWHSSYAAVPHYLTSELRSLFLENSEFSAFDLRREDRVRVEVFSGRVSGQILHGTSPAGLIEEYTAYAGRMRPLPGWILEGAVVGVQGGTGRVLEVLERLEAAGVPVAALWIQDWVGRRKTGFGDQLWWNWELDRRRYPGWERLAERLARRGIRLMTYINPFLVEVPGGGLFREARERGLLVADRRGEPYMIPITDFSAALLDLTDPEAREWIKQKIKERLLGSGASGWMADFGEGLPLDAALSSGEDATSYHNRYAEEWARLNREAIEEAGRGDAVFFTRSGYTRSPRYSTLFWLGDQLASWDRHDGIKSALTGMLSGGLSGYSLQHSDTGGYTAIDHPLARHRRSRELLLRWTEMNAFTAVLRTHEGNLPRANHQVYSDRETLRHFARLANVYAAWKPYREELVREAAETGLPVVRHPLIHHPDDPEAWGLRSQFMVGAEMMVAPVLDPGRERVEAYLPRGRWVHLWTGARCGSESCGTRETVEAPLGRPAVFYREGSGAGERLREELRRRGLLPS
ncbi:glycoside hydrolase, family 31 [Rubrobacter xylanophilus DSM 9941]|uniref:Glycoside hydrolase, family 31 n=1 Tax=Rubrobacter xylanophilus (strain DSM 9941 / JCM 11954 / NBRC 16129 / PRD-1) TaxID=266117 RepID=Q1ASX5_RUBXD|nr:alpha-glucosidase [Rubrobacter xylanophilus]ABG05503.1 glycoside hydrolase, family 31 [Rubrobacter xylanophilus DSM 9941]